MPINVTRSLAEYTYINWGKMGRSKVEKLDVVYIHILCIYFFICQSRFFKEGIHLSCLIWLRVANAARITIITSGAIEL